MKSLDRLADKVADLCEAKATTDRVTTGILVVLMALFFGLSARLLWQLNQLAGGM